MFSSSNNSLVFNHVESFQKENAESQGLWIYISKKNGEKIGTDKSTVNILAEVHVFQTFERQTFGTRYT